MTEFNTQFTIQAHLKTNGALTNEQVEQLRIVVMATLRTELQHYAPTTEVFAYPLFKNSRTRKTIERR